MKCTLSLFCLVLFFSLTTMAGFCQEKDFTSLDSLLDITINAASKYAQTASSAPSSVTIVTSQDIENYGYETLADVFASVKGFYISYDRNYSYAGVRGFSRPTDYNNRILLQINGFNINESIFGSAPIDTCLPLNPDMIDHIEIIRGPGSSLYGTNAMLAVVNVVTKTGNLIDGFEITPGFGGNGEKKAAAMFGMEKPGVADFMVSAVSGKIDGDDHYYEVYDSPSTNNGIAEGIDGTAFTNVFSTVSIGNVNICGMISSGRKEIPTGAWETDFNSNRHKTFDGIHSFGLSWNRQISRNQNLKISGLYNRYRYKASYPYLDDPDTHAIFYDSALGIYLDGEIQYTLDTSPQNRFIAGIEYRNSIRASYRYWSDQEEWYDDNSPFHVWSGYIQDTYQFRNDLSTTVGLRIDDHSSYKSRLTPRIAFIYNPYYTTTIKLVHGAAFRVPNVYESGYEEIDYWKRNPDLTEEKITTTELVWEQRLTRSLMSSVSAYVTRMNNMIDTVYDETEDLYFYDNIQHATAKGIELGIDGRFEENRGFYASYSFQKTEDEENKTRLTNSPAHLVKFGMSGRVFGDYLASGEIRYESERGTVQDTLTDGFVLANMGLSKMLIGDHIKLSLFVRNIFDSNYTYPGGFEHLQDSIMQDGRSYMFRIHLYSR